VHRGCFTRGCGNRPAIKTIKDSCRIFENANYFENKWKAHMSLIAQHLKS